MATLTDEMAWLAQDIFCRYVVAQGLQPEGGTTEAARKCIELSTQFFAVLESTQEGSQVRDRQELARDLASALMVELRSASPNGAPKEAPEAPAPPANPLPATRGKKAGKKHALPIDGKS